VTPTDVGTQPAVETLLAIESATDMVGVALVRRGGAVAERIHLGGRAHAELLIPSIEEVCAASGCTVADLDAVAVDVGPGLFTGLRVGVATAKALGQALSVGLVGVSSLDILAGAAREQPGAELPATVASVVDARRGEVFAAVYRFAPVPGTEGSGAPVDPGLVREDRPEPMDPDTLEAWLVAVAAERGRTTVVGDGAARYYPQLVRHAGLDLEGAVELSSPPPAALARLALARLARGEPATAARELVPDYRRPADARINWEQRAPRAAPPGGDGAA
jgi:tRNA threonylcarbamoyladenosine biosynthesis protein TsaB